MICPKCHTPMTYNLGSGYRCPDCGHQESTAYERRVPTPPPPMKPQWGKITLVEAFQAQFKQGALSERRHQEVSAFMTYEENQRRAQLEFEAEAWRNW